MKFSYDVTYFLLLSSFIFLNATSLGLVVKACNLKRKAFDESTSDSSQPHLKISSKDLAFKYVMENLSCLPRVLILIILDYCMSTKITKVSVLGMAQQFVTFFQVTGSDLNVQPSLGIMLIDSDESKSCPTLWLIDTVTQTTPQIVPYIAKEDDKLTKISTSQQSFSIKLLRSESRDAKLLFQNQVMSIRTGLRGTLNVQNTPILKISLLEAEGQLEKEKCCPLDTVVVKNVYMNPSFASNIACAANDLKRSNQIVVSCILPSTSSKVQFYMICFLIENVFHIDFKMKRR